MARARKPTNLHKTLERFSAAIVSNPEQHRGRWAETFMPEAREARLDLGCGKGSFIVAAALAEPDVLFVGLDVSDTCIARSAEKTVVGNIPNIVLITADATEIPEFFAAGELSRIYLNFNSPFPKKKHAEKRLTFASHLMTYRTLVGETGIVDMRTDNLPYWLFSLGQFEVAGYNVLWQTEDLHAVAATEQDQRPGGGALILDSEYDLRTVSKGATVYSLIAQPGPAPKSWEQTKPLGLVEYLPTDLNDLERLPYGMEDTIFNMRNRAANAAARQARRNARR